MQIIVKVSAGHASAARSVVAGRLAQKVPHGVVTEVFPGIVRGRRAGLVSVELPPGVSEQDVPALLEHLTGADEVEYAELPPTRTLAG